MFLFEMNNLIENRYRLLSSVITIISHHNNNLIPLFCHSFLSVLSNEAKQRKNKLVFFAGLFVFVKVYISKQQRKKKSVPCLIFLCLFCCSVA